MNKNQKKEEKQILKAYNMLLYFSGTMVMWDPSIECIHDFWNQEILKKLPVTSYNPRFIKAASQLRESVDDRNSGLEMMKNDFISLFTEPSGPSAAPVESVYHKKSEGRHEDVSGFYSSYGWRSKFRNHYPDDHLGVELLFLTLLIEKYIELDDEACNVEMRNEIKRFLNQHLLSWLPDWHDIVQKKAVSLSYKGISSLILACVEDIFGIMEYGLKSREYVFNLN